MSKEFDKKADADLLKECAEKREALRTFRFGIAGSKVRNMREGRSLRREVARYLTEINRRKHAQATD